jgi:glycosyltransferase involved in cell wall biosynthesis
MAESRPLRLAYLTSQYGRTSDVYVRGEVLRLRRMGHHIDTFSIRRPPESEAVGDEVIQERGTTDYILGGGVARLIASAARLFLRSPGRFLRTFARSRKLGYPGVKGRLWPLAYLLEAAYMAEKLRSKQIEHIHNHIGENSAAVAMLAAELNAITYSLTIHGPAEFDHADRLALNEKMARATFTAAISNYGRSQLCRWADLSVWDKIHVVYCGMHESFLDVPETPIPNEARIVTVGRLAPEKGQLLLVEAASRLAAEGHTFQLVIGGDGPLRPRLEQLIRDRNVGEYVSLIGWLSGEQVRAEILASRGLVISSFAEGLPAVLWESFALGRPVISSAIAGVPELVEHGRNGWLVNAGDLETLVAALREMITASPEILAAMGRAGKARALAQHDPAKSAREMDRLLVASVQRSGR